MENIKPHKFHNDEGYEGDLGVIDENNVIPQRAAYERDPDAWKKWARSKSEPKPQPKLDDENTIWDNPLDRK